MFDLLPTAHISDSAVARALGGAVTVINPALDVVWGSDPLGLKTRRSDGTDGPLAEVLDAVTRALNAAEIPGTPAWDELTVAQREDWWVHRVGAVNTLIVAFPGLLGVIADRLPLQDVLGFVNQAAIIIAVAREHGLRDRDDQVRLLAAVLCDRAVGGTVGAQDNSIPARAERPTGVLGVVWNTGGAVRGVVGELGKRPQPAQVFRILGMLPVVGAVADYLGEYRALVHATDEGKRWLTGHPAAE